MDGQTDGIAVASTALAMWRAVKIEKAPYLDHSLTDFDQIWQRTQFGPLELSDC